MKRSYSLEPLVWLTTPMALLLVADLEPRAEPDVCGIRCGAALNSCPPVPIPAVVHRGTGIEIAIAR